MPQHLTVIVPWYYEEDYGRLLCTCSDSHLFPRSFQEWRGMAEEIHEEIQLRGMAPLKVFLDPDDFFIWCKRGGVTPNGQARLRFAETLAGRRTTGVPLVYDTVAR